MLSKFHVAITRQIQPGREAEFEKLLKQFAQQSLQEAGTTGVHLIGPVPLGANAPDSGHYEYGILRSFENQQACEAFYQSDLYRAWSQQVEPLVLGPPVRRPLSGLEAFFHQRGQTPPRWKMAILTWMGVIPTAYTWTTILPHPLAGLPALVRLAIVNGFVVATLVWGVMPLLTRWAAPWLNPKHGDSRRGLAPCPDGPITASSQSARAATAQAAAGQAPPQPAMAPCAPVAFAPLTDTPVARATTMAAHRPTPSY